MTLLQNRVARTVYGVAVLLLPRVTLLQNVERRYAQALQVLLLPRVTLLQNTDEVITPEIEFCCYPE